MALARDACVVPTESLAELLDGFVDRWRSERPPTAGRFAPAQQRTEVPFVGPVDFLVEATRNYDPEGLGVSPSAIERIRGRRSKTTELRTADYLVAALDCPQAWHDGTLEVSCCGGSLTGGLDPSFWNRLASCVSPNQAV